MLAGHPSILRRMLLEQSRSVRWQRQSIPSQRENLPSRESSMRPDVHRTSILFGSRAMPVTARQAVSDPSPQ